ncbi:MAG: metallophosphoesterase [Bacteroidota bacterium]
MNRKKFLQYAATAGIPLILPWDMAPTTVSEDESEAELTIGLVADAHQDIMHDCEERLAAFVAATLERQTDVNIQLGDFCFPIPDNKPFLNIWNQYKGPKYHVLGNHDMDVCTKAEVMDYWGMEAPHYSFDLKGYHFVVLDANFLYLEGRFSDYAHGNFYIDDAFRTWIHPEQIDWLGADLRATNLPTIVFSHQGLAHDLWGVKNRRQIQLLLEAANEEAGFSKVIACFNGHNHVDDCRKINGIYYVEMNSLSYQWLGEKYQCFTRYPKEIYERKPNLSKVAPFRDPLYALITLSKGKIVIEGIESRWIGPSPSELGLPKNFYSIPYSPEISDQLLKID